MEMRITTYAAVVCILVMYTDLTAQCPSTIWNTSNQGSAYVETKGKKTIFGDLTNTNSSQYVNDGRLFLFGDIKNDGYLGDGFGSEYIRTCDETQTLLEGRGQTEFNNLFFKNPFGMKLQHRMRIKTRLQFEEGIIHSDRSNPIYKTIFAPQSGYGGSGDTRHIDGVVTKLGIGPFVFPVGDGDHLSPIKVRGVSPFDEFEACYVSDNVPIEETVRKGEYPVESTDRNVARVQEKEFWTLKGGQATTVTLYWTRYSRINELVSSTDDLIVVGWENDKWVNLGNIEKDEFFGTGTLSSRVIRPNDYQAFTFGVLDTDGDDLPDSEDENPFDPCDPNPNIEACLNQQCLTLESGVWLEGALYRGGSYTDEMQDDLFDFGYLPGLRPRTLLGIAADPGQPYGVAPWQYNGSEGMSIDEINNVINSDRYPEGVVDWVLVSLRTGIEESSTICTKAAVVLKNGDIVLTEYFDCCDLKSNITEYYVVVEHRNHLAVMSPTPITPDADGVLRFDFRTNQSYMALLGYTQKEISPGRYAMYAGNGDQTVSFESSRDINANDNGTWARDNGLHSGYYFQDFDLNGDVNVHDKALWAINNGIFTDVEPINN